MPKLNLDIFGQDEDTGGKRTREPMQKEQPVADRAETKSVTTRKQESQPTPGSARPKFVPVGFHEKHLRLLDDAVLKLRREGYWKASKSAIIRFLIERHRGDLDKIWLEGHMKDASSSQSCRE